MIGIFVASAVVVGTAAVAQWEGLIDCSICRTEAGFVDISGETFDTAASEDGRGSAHDGAHFDDFICAGAGSGDFGVAVFAFAPVVAVIKSFFSPSSRFAV